MNDSAFDPRKISKREITYSWWVRQSFANIVVFGVVSWSLQDNETFDKQDRIPCIRMCPS